MPPRLSIVTPTYNQAETLEETLKSVLSQDMGALLQYTVVDGCSTDATPDIVARLAPRFVEQGVEFAYVREPDDGQSDAINKGWRSARGEIAGYLNSDDYYEPGALRGVVDYFDAHPDIAWAYGGWRLVSRSRHVYVTKRHAAFSRARFLNYCDIGQPSCFFRRRLLDKVGMLDTKYHLAMDYHLWVRFADLSDAGMIPGILSCMRYHESAKSSARTRAQAVEVYRIAASRTQAFSFRRLMQTFYLLRALVAISVRHDVARRIGRLE